MILNMIIHRSFTGATHLLSANVQGTVSFVVSLYTYIYIYCLCYPDYGGSLKSDSVPQTLSYPDYDGSLKSDSVSLLSRL